MSDVLERVVAENRQLRVEVDSLRRRIAALESSRWWRLNPRVVLRRPWFGRGPASGSQGRRVAVASPAKLKEAIRVARLKVRHDERNVDCMPNELVLRDGIRLKLHPESLQPLLAFSYSSPESVDEMDSFLVNTVNKQRLLDVGALHGAFSLAFVARYPDKAALAVDASPIAFAKLLYNIHTNRLFRITPVECALSSSAGELEMHYEWEHAVAGPGVGDLSSRRVATRTGDSVCQQHAFVPDVIKVDVEGHEVKVIEGLRQTIARSRPVIFLELHADMVAETDTNGSIADLSAELSALGYRKAEVQGRVVPIEELQRLRGIERLLLRPEEP